MRRSFGAEVRSQISSICRHKRPSTNRLRLRRKPRPNGLCSDGQRTICAYDRESLLEAVLGRGIVEPADDMDAHPWNEDLLDWLASDFVANGYDLQHLIGASSHRAPINWKPPSEKETREVVHLPSARDCAGSQRNSSTTQSPQ